ncbi:MAG: hypothetical protein PHO91_00600 [Patescibacteria group bacterium]|nr:hypothetical protein [Patescibacteria group bacterium]
MVILVIACPEISGVDLVLRGGLRGLYLRVDDSFAADGYYHVRAQELLTTLRKEGRWGIARLWEQVIQYREWSHLAISADFGRIVVHDEAIEVEL